MRLYQSCYRVRRAEETIVAEYPRGQMKSPMHMSLGQEAIAVGVCAALCTTDQVYSTYRSHAAYLAKTDDVVSFFGELYGKKTGSARGKAGSMHMSLPERGFMGASAIVGSMLPVAVGAAFALKRQGTGRVACTFFGDGAVDEGAFWESLNVAAVMRLPVLFVCENNGFAIHTAARHRHGYDSITKVASAFRMHVRESEGTDVETVHGHALEALASIKEESRPAFLHLKCYRYLEHVGVRQDFSVGYRSEAEYLDWKERDPIARQRARLIAGGVAEESVIAVEREIDDEVAAAVAAAKDAAFTPLEDLYEDVLA